VDGYRMPARVWLLFFLPNFRPPTAAEIEKKEEGYSFGVRVVADQLWSRRDKPDGILPGARKKLI
jgi:hypothetical protein